MSEKRKRTASLDSLHPEKRQAIADWVYASNDGDSLPSIESPTFSKMLNNISKSTEPIETISHELSQTPSRSDRTSTSKLSASSEKYEIELRRRNIRNGDKKGSEPDPFNLQEIQDFVSSNRASPELTAELHKAVRTKLIAASTEAAVLSTIKNHLLRQEWDADRPALVQECAPWDQYVPIRMDLKPQLSDPMPDMAYGWEWEALRDLDAKDALTDWYINETKKNRDNSYDGEERSYQSPETNLFWPVATLEGKGPRANLEEAHLKNEYNAAVMLNNIFHLKRRANRPLPYGQALVFTVDIVHYHVGLTYHWVATNNKMEDVFWSRILRSWSLADPSLSQWNTARKSIRNAIEWARKRALPDIRADLVALLDIQPEHAISPGKKWY